MSDKPCAQTILVTDNNPIPCDGEYYSTECVIHPDAMVELNLPEDSSTQDILNAFLNAIINLNNQVGENVGNPVISGELSGNNIVLTRDDLTTVVIDVSDLYDDTNLSRITSGAIVGTDLVLTRDDLTTITIPLAGGFEQNNIVRTIDLGVVEVTPPQTAEEAVADAINALDPNLVVEEDEIIIFETEILIGGAPS